MRLSNESEYAVSTESESEAVSSVFEYILSTEVSTDLPTRMRPYRACVRSITSSDPQVALKASVSQYSLISASTNKYNPFN